MHIQMKIDAFMLWGKAGNSLFGEKNVCLRRVSADDIHSFTELTV